MKEESCVYNHDIPMSRFRFGDIVYLRVRSEKKPGMVTGITHRPSAILYGVAFETGETWHYEIELSETFIQKYD